MPAFQAGREHPAVQEQKLEGRDTFRLVPSSPTHKRTGEGHSPYLVATLVVEADGREAQRHAVIGDWLSLSMLHPC